MRYRYTVSLLASLATGSTERIIEIDAGAKPIAVTDIWWSFDAPKKTTDNTATADAAIGSAVGGGTPLAIIKTDPLAPTPLATAVQKSSTLASTRRRYYLHSLAHLAVSPRVPLFVPAGQAGYIVLNGPGAPWTTRNCISTVVFEE